jgi:hypothetical protein
MEGFLKGSLHLTDDRPALRRVEVIDAPINLGENLGLPAFEHEEVQQESADDRDPSHAEDALVPYSEPEAFALTVPDDLPAVYRYSIVLDVLSTVLRDCDQVPEPGLKARLL